MQKRYSPEGHIGNIGASLYESFVVYILVLAYFKEANLIVRRYFKKNMRVRWNH